MLLCIMNIGS